MINLLRRSRQGTRIPLPRNLMDHDAESPAEPIAQVENIAWLVAVMSKLTPEELDLLVRRYYRGEKISEIARAKGVAPNTMAQRHLRLLDRMRKMRTP